MPPILPVAITDTFEQWRLKTNGAITATNTIINAESIADMIVLEPPVNDGDTLIYDSVDGVFHNYAFEQRIQEWADDNSIRPTSRVREYYLQTSLNIQ